MCLTPMTHALQIHQLLFPVLYTGYKDLKSEKTKDKSHNERCILTIYVYGYFMYMYQRGGVGSFHKSAHAHLQ